MATDEYGSTTNPPRSWTQRLPLLGTRAQVIPGILEPLLQALTEVNPKADQDLVIRAFHVAERCHRGQVRKSGDPYITHPVAVATILAELGLPVSTVAAAILHDTVEDTDYSLEQLTKEFGEEIAMLVDGVTKLDKVQYGDAAQSETVRKMVVAMAKDIRVLMIKLADRLHNARTWKFVSSDSAKRKAKETLEIYAPLAHRLGMNAIKWELEDLSFATLYPKVYQQIVQMVSERAPAREEELELVRQNILSDLKAAKIKAVVTSRPKHYYSIYQKMIVRGRDFDEIYDLIAARVLVDSERECYATLGALHARWTPVPGRFKDYIAMPKFNMYQSLHTTVIGPLGKPVEIQIRTHDMHRRSEYGVAAHWKYKQANKKQVSTKNSDLPWLQQLVDWQRETSDPGEFLDSLRFEIGSAEVYVFTPKGDVIGLPVGATPVDFAYSVHTEVGHRTVGAKVNNRLVPLDSVLENGDVVEVFTNRAENAAPSRDWLNFVKSGRAKSKIKQWFTKERREESIEQGRNAIAKELRKQSLPIQRILNQEILLTVANDLNYADVSGLYSAVGQNQVSAAHVVKRINDFLGPQESHDEDISELTAPGIPTRAISDGAVQVVGTDDVLVKLARCCTPVPGDDIVGFVTRGNGVSVHQRSCTNMQALAEQKERIVDVTWGTGTQATFLVQIQVEALDRSGLLSDVTRSLSDSHVNIISSSSHTSDDRVAIFKFVFELADPKHLNSVLANIRKVNGVYDVYRTANL